jgi:hypothetical protein
VNIPATRPVEPALRTMAGRSRKAGIHLQPVAHDDDDGA